MALNRLKTGEKALLGGLGLMILAGVLSAVLHKSTPHEKDIPFYSTAPASLGSAAGDLLRHYSCRDCHSLWTTRDATQAVPAPMLDGMGSLHDRNWLYAYLSAPEPQKILPSRLKLQYRHPSYANLPESERAILADYLASLKVQDWYLDETRRLEHDKLTGDSTAEK